MDRSLCGSQRRRRLGHDRPHLYRRRRRALRLDRKLKITGGLAGGTWGYNYQIGAWVFGAESDLDWANIRGTFTAAVPGVVTGSLSTKLNWLSTYRARVGYTWGPAMLYATGGAAVGNITATAAGTVPAIPATWLDLAEQYRARLDRRRRLRIHVHAAADRED